MKITPLQKCKHCGHGFNPYTGQRIKNCCTECRHLEPHRVKCPACKAKSFRETQEQFDDGLITFQEAVEQVKLSRTRADKKAACCK